MNCCMMSLIELPKCKVVVSHEFVIHTKDLLHNPSLHLESIIDSLTLVFRTCDLSLHLFKGYDQSNIVNSSIGNSSQDWIVTAC